MRTARFLFLCMCCVLGFTVLPLQAAETGEVPQLTDPAQEFRKVAAQTNIPWFYIAAIYQYESSIHNKKKLTSGQSAVQIPAQDWCGPMNPNQLDRDEGTIRVFHGIGRDGNKDGIADPTNQTDVIYSLANLLRSNGLTEDDIQISLWNRYEDTMVVDRVVAFARIYNQFSTADLSQKAFPIPNRYNYSYRSTWGDKRGWGGRRMHEGTDIFADYGTPVVATSYGYVEMKGWNKFGGWRIGIRDLNNVYHYYAHLSAYAKGIQTRSIVTPGQVIGYVGSSGYGKPGTSGKFAPHLHYGMYFDNGTRSYAVDPAPHLRRWELQSRRK
ncbi:M23 family metallopeptidase [Effusibacillus dendaii]|uniref:L-Ala--D-Glu endopeptidase n=1 Tax=Effusibacillus dendaii TaxID=2743772 RepID=A0A7I8DCX8_9BACL|nr:M23 family metallopeptidase [Effusibacillus dendaii]BCJ88063.1 L-Ala--D-Glu endopeptidase [Effusibacillus dendaii]